MVMVVVPAFSQGGESDQEAVAAGVGGSVAAPAEDVGEGVHDERAVPQEHRADKEAPDQRAPSAEKENRDRKAYGWHQEMTVQPVELGILREISDRAEVGLIVGVAQDPAQMGPEKALLER